MGRVTNLATETGVSADDGYAEWAEDTSSRQSAFELGSVIFSSGRSTLRS